MDRPTCKTCPFFDTRDEARANGDCSRMPPSPMMLSAARDANDEWEARAVWPRVTGDDWCGEHPGSPAYIAGLKATTPDA